MNPRTDHWYERPIPDPIATVTPWEFHRLELLAGKTTAELEMTAIDKAQKEIIDGGSFSLHLKYSLYQEFSKSSRIFRAIGYFKIDRTLYLVNDSGGILCPEKYIQVLKNYVKHGASREDLIYGYGRA